LEYNINKYIYKQYKFDKLVL